MDLNLFQSSAAGLIDRTNPEVIQLVDTMIQLMETPQKIIDCVNIREDDPVITEKVLDGLVERDVTLGLVNPSLRCSDYARAREFKFNCKPGRCARRRNQNGSISECLIIWNASHADKIIRLCPKRRK